MVSKPKQRRLPLYSAKIFRGDGKDATIDVVHTALDDAGLSYREAAEKSGGVAASTIHNWIEGKTMRPQNCTLAAVMEGLGWEQAWRNMDNGRLLTPGIGHNSRRRRSPPAPAAA